MNMKELDLVSRKDVYNTINSVPLDYLAEYEDLKDAVWGIPSCEDFVSRNDAIRAIHLKFDCIENINCTGKEIANYIEEII